MEWIAIGLLAVFGWFQTERLNDAQAEADKWQQQTKENYEDYQELKKVNEENVVAVDNIKVDYDQCVIELVESRGKQIDYERLNEESAVRIEELEDLINNSDPDSCVNNELPDWFEF